MVGKTLVASEYVAAGRKLVEFLDAAGVGPHDALWFYKSETEDWNLLLATSTYDKAGPLKATAEVQKVFRAHAGELNPLEFDDLRVKGTKDRPFSLLRGVVTTGPGVSELRFTNNRIDNSWIDDALIYRMQGTA